MENVVNGIKNIGQDIKNFGNKAIGWVGNQIDKMENNVKNKYMINDETEKNLQTQIGSIYNESKKLLEEQHAREDRIRSHVESREDSAYTRAVRDMQRAGINPNLMDVNPANSGGGITSATGLDTSMITKAQEEKINTLLEMYKQEWKDYEMTWDNVITIINGILGNAGGLATTGISAIAGAIAG